jgi:hypothetical protein
LFARRPSGGITPADVARHPTMTSSIQVRRTGLLRAVAAASGLYDLLLAVALAGGREAIGRWLGVPVPAPLIHVDLNALFAGAIGVGYILPYRDPVRYRGYLWVMGPLLKGAGTGLFVVDHLVRHSPAAFLAFAATDGALALLTLAALLASPPQRGRVPA